MKYTLSDLRHADAFVDRAERHVERQKQLIEGLDELDPCLDHQRGLVSAYQFALTEHTRRREVIRANLHATVVVELFPGRKSQ